MIREAYVSFEIAQLLKEKGFREGCHANYVVIGSNIGQRQYLANTVLSDTPRGTDFNWDNGAWVSCPTYQMALAWLREKGVIIVIDYNADEDCEENERWGFSTYTNSQRKVDFATYPTYEEAIEAALKYSLENLI